MRVKLDTNLDENKELLEAIFTLIAQCINNNTDEVRHTIKFCDNSELVTVFKIVSK